MCRGTTKLEPVKNLVSNHYHGTVMTMRKSLRAKVRPAAVHMQTWHHLWAPTVRPPGGTSESSGRRPRPARLMDSWGSEARVLTRVLVTNPVTNKSIPDDSSRPLPYEKGRVARGLRGFESRDRSLMASGDDGKAGWHL